MTIIPNASSDTVIEIQEAEVNAGEFWRSQTLDLGLNSIEVVVGQSEHNSRTYTVEVDRGAINSYLKARNAGKGHQFGHDVAISGDTIVLQLWTLPNRDSGVPEWRSSRAARVNSASSRVGSPMALVSIISRSWSRKGRTSLSALISIRLLIKTPNHFKRLRGFVAFIVFVE